MSDKPTLWRLHDEPESVRRPPEAFYSEIGWLVLHGHVKPEDVAGIVDAAFGVQRGDDE